MCSQPPMPCLPSRGTLWIRRRCRQRYCASSTPSTAAPLAAAVAAVEGIPVGEMEGVAGEAAAAVAAAAEIATLVVEEAVAAAVVVAAAAEAIATVTREAKRSATEPGSSALFERTLLSG
mmetsp:Transcript_2706/g.8010  ORF Transcript_2706/g.8010 Transcript_2706/m.8010 type:complete len:120 (-) Transcript_2706:233-592(-)